MATTFESLSLAGIRPAHLSQLLAYIEARDKQEWHYGNKKQFKKRHEELRAWIQNAVNYAYSEDVLMPKK